MPPIVVITIISKEGDTYDVAELTTSEHNVEIPKDDDIIGYIERFLHTQDIICNDDVSFFSSKYDISKRMNAFNFYEHIEKKVNLNLPIFVVRNRYMFPEKCTMKTAYSHDIVSTILKCSSFSNCVFCHADADAGDYSCDCLNCFVCGDDYHNCLCDDKTHFPIFGYCQTCKMLDTYTNSYTVKVHCMICLNRIADCSC